MSQAEVVLTAALESDFTPSGVSVMTHLWNRGASGWDSTGKTGKTSL